MSGSREHTHKAIARHRYRNALDWVEIGKGRFEIDPESGEVTIAHIVLNRTPIGGFDGYVRLLPWDAPMPSLGPQRPSRPSENPDEYDLS
jgi:hypothetical protein